MQFETLGSYVFFYTKNVITQWIPLNAQENPAIGIRITLNSRKIKVEKISNQIFSTSKPVLVILEGREFSWKKLKLQNFDNYTKVEKLKKGLKLVKKSDTLDHAIAKIQQAILFEHVAKPYASNRWFLAGVS